MITRVCSGNAKLDGDDNLHIDPEEEPLATSLFELYSNCIRTLLVILKVGVSACLWRAR